MTCCNDTTQTSADGWALAPVSSVRQASPDNVCLLRSFCLLLSWLVPDSCCFRYFYIWVSIWVSILAFIARGPRHSVCACAAWAATAYCLSVSCKSACFRAEVLSPAETSRTTSSKAGDTRLGVTCYYATCEVHAQPGSMSNRLSAVSLQKHILPVHMLVMRQLGELVA